MICIEFRDLGRRVYLHPSEGGFRMSDAAAQPPAVTLRGSLTVFARLGLAGSGAEVAPGDLEIEGDVALGQKMHRILQQLDLDWEEPLARLLGDPLGHAVGQGLRAAWAWQAHAVKTLSLDAAEYLREEARLVPTRRELEGFLDAVDTLRADVDRLEVLFPDRFDKAHQPEDVHAGDVLFVGDDDNDEDAFALPGNTVPVRVGRKLRSHARYYLRRQSEIDRLLELLVGLRVPGATPTASGIPSGPGTEY